MKSFKTLIQLLGVHLENSRSIKIILFSLFSVNPQIYSDILGLPPHCAQFPLHATSDAMRVLLLLSTHRGGLMANVGSQSWKGCCPYMGVSINEDTPKWMVYKGITYSNDFKWMIWRYPHFRKPPYCHPTILPQIKATTIWSSLVCLSSILGNVQNGSSWQRSSLQREQSIEPSSNILGKRTYHCHCAFWYHKTKGRT